MPQDNNLMPQRRASGPSRGQGAVGVLEGFGDRAEGLPGQAGGKGNDLGTRHHGALGVAVEGAAHAAHHGSDLLSPLEQPFWVGIDPAGGLDARHAGKVTPSASRDGYATRSG
jgi:hypothetical protein